MERWYYVKNIDYVIEAGLEKYLRNKRRSLITLTAVLFASFMAITMRGIQLGTFALNIKTVAELFSGYIQIQEKSYHDNPRINASFQLDKKIVSELNNTKSLVGYSPRIYADGLISFKDDSRGTAKEFL